MNTLKMLENGGDICMTPSVSGRPMRCAGPPGAGIPADDPVRAGPLYSADPLCDTPEERMGRLKDGHAPADQEIAVIPAETVPVPG